MTITTCAECGEPARHAGKCLKHYRQLAYTRRKERWAKDPAAHELHKELQRGRMRKWHSKQTYEANYERYLKTIYGMKFEDYMRLHSEQDGQCAICHRQYKAVDKAKAGRLYVDHDHGSGNVRGLLCHSCNTGIGHLRDDPEFLANAMSYLKRTKHPPFIRYVRIFAIGFFLVALVASNTKQIVGGHYLGAFIVGYLISLLWATGVQKIHHEGFLGACVYAAGAALGTIAAMGLMTWVYGA